MKSLDLPVNHPTRDVSHKRKRTSPFTTASNVLDTDQTTGLLDDLSFGKAEPNEDDKKGAGTFVDPPRFAFTIDRLNTKESVFGKREVTPHSTNQRVGDRQRTNIFNAASPAYNLLRERSVIDLTASSPYMKKESCTPSIQLFAYRSQSVIEISSDSDSDDGGNSSDTLSSDDPAKYFTAKPSRPRPADTVIQSRLPPIDEDQTPKPPRTGNMSRACHLSSPTPTQKNDRLDPQASLAKDNDIEQGMYEGRVGDSDRVHDEPKVYVRSGGVPQRLDGLAHSLQVGLSSFRDLPTARNALLQFEEKRGYQWIVQKTVLDKEKQPRKVVWVCRCAKEHKPSHDPSIDPGQLREGRSVKTGCKAVANFLRGAGGEWSLTRYKDEHNHDREIPVGGFARTAPTTEQIKLVEELDAKGKFNRAQIAAALSVADPNSTLEPRQLSNMLNKLRAERRVEVVAKGGDFQAIITHVHQRIEEGEDWFIRIRLDETGTITAIFWQSPNQRTLARRFYDIVINDNAQNRNQYQFPHQHRDRSRPPWQESELVLRCASPRGCSTPHVHPAKSPRINRTPSRYIHLGPGSECSVRGCDRISDRKTHHLPSSHAGQHRRPRPSACQRSSGMGKILEAVLGGVPSSVSHRV